MCWLHKLKKREKNGSAASERPTSIWETICWRDCDAPLDSQPEWGGVLECVNHFHLHLFTELLRRVHETAAVLPVNACR